MCICHFLITMAEIRGVASRCLGHDLGVILGVVIKKGGGKRKLAEYQEDREKSKQKQQKADRKAKAKV